MVGAVIPEPQHLVHWQGIPPTLNHPSVTDDECKQANEIRCFGPALFFLVLVLHSYSFSWFCLASGTFW